MRWRGVDRTGRFLLVTFSVNPLTPWRSWRLQAAFLKGFPFHLSHTQSMLGTKRNNGIVQN